MNESRPSNLPSFLLLVAFVLTPLVFIPANWTPFVFNKLYFLGFLSLIAFLIAAGQALLRRRLSLIAHPLLIAVWLITLAYAVAALFGPTPKLSLFGNRLEVDTFAFVALAAFLATLSAHLLATRRHLSRLLQGSVIVFVLIGLYVALRLMVGASFLSFGIFTDLTSNFFGGWNDLALLAGLATILCLNLLRVGILSPLKKLLTFAGLVASLFFLVLTNYFTALLVVSIVAAGFFLLELLSSIRVRTLAPMMRLFTLSTIAVAIVAGLFAFQSGIGGSLSTAVGISQLEARPSWATTIDIGKNVLKESPLIGSGPNTFVSKWLEFKPSVVNSTPFWNVDFSQGVGTIPTALITTGALGILAYGIFLLLLILASIQFFTKVGGRESFYASTFALTSLYLVTFCILYTPSPVTVLFAFISVGLFVAALIAEGYLIKREINLEVPTWGSYLVQLSLAAGVIVAVVLFVFISGRYGAALYAGKASVKLQLGDGAGAKESIASALAFAHIDEYERIASVANLTELGKMIQKENPTDADKALAQAELTSAIAHASTAVLYNGANYQNWLALAQVYVAILPLQVEGAYDNAKTSLTRAIQLNPKNPDLELTLARLELSNNKAKEGREHLTQSLALKSDYTAALYLLAQLEVAEGKVPEAISALLAMQQILPNEPTIYFMLGYLLYTTNDDTNAIIALEEAVRLNAQYANARYFLGLAYARAGKSAEAIAQFEEVAKTNPENADVKAVLANLKAGKAPFTNSPASSRPDQRSSPPISGE